jgi:molybdopterin molybdotransferase
MPEFLTLMSPEAALDRLFDHLSVTSCTELVGIDHSLGRVTAAAVIADQPLPSFPRSTVDGYALRAIDTYGASESLPAYLSVSGEVMMGAAATFDVPVGHCALIHTGGMLPEEADAVIMLEHTQTVKSGEIEILRAVALGENVIRVGEDVEVGQEVISAGVRLGAAEIGGLAALGINQVLVSCKPRVAILSSGDEVVPLDAQLLPGQVRDVNSFALGALVERCGGQPVSYGILPDSIEALAATARRAIDECDMVIFTAGSSASTRDLTAQVIDSLGAPGVLVHGINIRPGKPTILGVCNGKVVIGLPGNPVSALVIAGLFVAPVIERWLGMNRNKLMAFVPASLSINLASQAGREDWIPVRLLPGGDGYIAEPVFGKSNLIFTLVRADGLFCIPQDVTGLEAGAIVKVYPFVV